MGEQITTQEWKQCFKLIDEHVRTVHLGFVSEFFFSSTDDRYFLCPRPVGTTKDDPNRYTCKYVQLSAGELRRVLTGGLPVEIAEQLAKSLSTLPH